MRLCTHCGGDSPRRSIYGEYFCDDDCIGDHIESLRAQQKNFAASLADRTAELECLRDKTPVGQRLIINGLIGQAQAIAHDYETAKGERS